MAELNLWYFLGYALIILGLAGAVVPVVPGPLLIWLGALSWAWGNDFQAIGPALLTGLGILALLAWGMDLLLSYTFSRRTGASWKSFVGAIMGGLGGGILFSGVVPVLGTLVGAFLGAVVGTWAVEYYAKRDMRAALRAAQAYVASFLLSSFLEIILAIAMVAIFVWRALL
jgi:uncharacterized protein YqgC (DUF456 family)